MTPPVGDPAGFADALAAALGAADIAAVCLRLAATDERTLSNRIKALAPVVQDKGAALLLATEPVERVSGRVTYSQQILREFGWIESARGRGVDSRGSGYSEI